MAEMERATADLLRLAFVEIRFLTEDRQEDQSPEAAARRRKHANAIADICHNLPGLLAPGRRDRLADGLWYLWSTANAARRRWLVGNWDHLAYDHRWLTAPTPGDDTRHRP
ncbi:hypothetical protein AB0K00_55585 [Dactylosporangium sp. NPDC049525]|uniref:hypothetical protein n=1 Tax=Dactylosporangium sp. NPDC049525 TaxID=3154730 RepID=UPI0034437886